MEAYKASDFVLGTSMFILPDIKCVLIDYSSHFRLFGQLHFFVTTLHSSFFLLFSYFQDDTTFEKQSALFALAIADIVLINMYVSKYMLLMYRFDGYHSRLELTGLMPYDLQKIWQIAGAGLLESDGKNIKGFFS